jgi:hypothetical protein
VFFPDLTSAATTPVGEDLQSNLIMPEPTVFFPELPNTVCSIIASIRHYSEISVLSHYAKRVAST